MCGVTEWDGTSPGVLLFLSVIGKGTSKNILSVSHLSTLPYKAQPCCCLGTHPFWKRAFSSSGAFFSQREAHPSEQNCWLVKASCLISLGSLCLGCDCNSYRAITVSAVTKTKPLMDGQGWALTRAPGMDICSKGDVTLCLTRPK